MKKPVRDAVLTDFQKRIFFTSDLRKPCWNRVRSILTEGSCTSSDALTDQIVNKPHLSDQHDQRPDCGAIMTNQENVYAGSQRRLWILLFIVAGLGGCATRPGVDALAVRQRPSGSHQTVTVVTATDRQRDITGVGYTARRSEKLQFERFTVAARETPDARGKTDSARKPTSARKYVVTRREPIAARNINANKNALIYVHGYNYTFQESLFQLSRVVADGGLTEVPILFSWPSNGTVTGYIADKDAAAFARDDLVTLLAVSKKQNPDGKVTLFGHSMGAWIVIEALRQLKLSNRDDILRHVDQVVLAAPDIDVELFKRQINTIGRLTKPILVLSATDDRALTISSRLGGARARMGMVDQSDPAIQELVADGAIRIVDLSAVPAPDKTNHNRFINLVSSLSDTKKRTVFFLATK